VGTASAVPTNTPVLAPSGGAIQVTIWDSGQ
jgi:hypothetical protein